MSLGQKIRQGSMWLMAGKVSSRLVEFAFGVALARILVPADFGMLVTVQVFTGLAGFLAGGGMGQALIQAKEVDPRDFNIVFSIQLAICVLIYLIFYITSPWIADWFNTPLYEQLLKVSALSFLLRPFNIIPYSILSRQYQFKRTASIRLTALFVSGVVSVVMALLDYGVWSLVIGGLSGGVVTIPLLMIVARWRPAFSYDAQVARRLGGYGVRVSSNDLLVYFRFQSPNVILSHIVGAAAVGSFNKAFSLSRLPRELISGPVEEVGLRGLSEVQGDLETSKYYYFRILSMLVLYMLPLYVILFWVADSFVAVVFGPKWLQIIIPLKVLALTGITHCLIAPAGQLIAAQNKLGREIPVNVLALVLLTAGCIVLAEDGLYPIALLLLGTQLVTALLMTRLALSLVKGGFGELLVSVMPVFRVNVVLVVLLWLCDVAFRYAGLAVTDFFYGFLLGAGGLLIYFLLLNVMPLHSMTSEVEKIRKLVLMIPGRILGSR